MKIFYGFIASIWKHLKLSSHEFKQKNLERDAWVH